MQIPRTLGMTKDLMRGEGHKRHNPGALDRFADDPLVLHAGAALATRKNLAGSRGETLQTANIFVIEFINGVGAQVAGALFEGGVLLFLTHEDSSLVVSRLAR